MHTTLAQLPLRVDLKDEATFENFYPSKNEEIITQLKIAASGQAKHLIYIYGNRGQGCSHLLQACCHYAYTKQLRSVYFPLANLQSMSPQILEGIEELDLVCIDDLHVVAQQPLWEEAIFHLHNKLQDAGRGLIIAAHDLPKGLSLNLADLESRLAGGMIYHLHSLSDEEKLSTLIKRAHLRGIHLSQEVGKYLLNHCPRHMSTLFAALDVLDKASLAAQRKLTIPFVKEILQI